VVARAAKYDILFEPIQVGPQTLKNRFYQTPHCCGFGTENPGAQASMRGTKAEGGWAVVNTEATLITPESDSAPWVLGTLWSADDVANLRWMTERVHEHGGLAGVQLSYTGPHHSGLRTRLPARGVSQLSGGRFGAACAEMDKSEIRSAQETYVEAAKLAREAGMDLVQVSGREAGSLPIHCLMPFWNKGTDEYGGSLENRARFCLETLEVVRDAVGDDMAIVVGHTIDTLEHGGDDGRLQSR
jgi:dimethylamine/trimethylamine dehydrogenase